MNSSAPAFVAGRPPPYASPDSEPSMPLPFKRKSIVLAAAGAAIIAVAFTVSVSREPTPAAPLSRVTSSAARVPVLSVAVETPVSQEMGTLLQAHGEIAAWQEAVIGSETGGMRLEQVHAAVGDQVRAGQLLATFAGEAARADIAVAEAALSEAKAVAIEAAGNGKRARALRSSGALSEQQVSQILTAEHTAAARVESAQAHLGGRKLQLKYTVLRAPDNGIISARNATIGAVPAQGAELFRMVRQGRLEWRAEVPGSELGKLRPGLEAEVTGPDGTSLRGRIRAIGATVDSASRNALVYVDLARTGAAGSLRPGIYARGQFSLGTQKALTVSQQAVVLRDGFSYVFRLRPDGHVTQTRVTVGRILGGRVEIVDGLDADTQVVAQGGAFLNDGDAVRHDPKHTAALATMGKQP